MESVDFQHAILTAVFNRFLQNGVGDLAFQHHFRKISPVRHAHNATDVSQRLADFFAADVADKALDEQRFVIDASILKITGRVPSLQQAIMTLSSFVQFLMMEPP